MQSIPIRTFYKAENPYCICKIIYIIYTHAKNIVLMFTMFYTYSDFLSGKNHIFVIYHFLDNICFYKALANGMQNDSVIENQQVSTIKYPIIAE